MRIGCVVMASGEGCRFAAAGGAGNKLLAPVAGRALVARTVGSVPGVLEGGFETVVTTRWPAVAELCAAGGGACVLHGGALRSDAVRAGLLYGAARWDGCLFLPGDQPLVRAESFYALRAAFEAEPDAPARLAWRGCPASPVLFPRRLFAALMALEGSDGGRSVLAAEPRTALVEARGAEELLDVDTPDDLARVEEALRGRFDADCPQA